MTRTEPSPPGFAPAVDQDSIPPLENGDRLTREEFERRYEAMPDHVKAELIEGIVYMASPVRHRKHGRPHIWLAGWLATYESCTPGVEAGDNGSVRLDLDNEPQPDAYLFIDRDRGGQARLAPDDYVDGAPEFVAEVASSSVSGDLGGKLNAYRRNGVKEYLVWRVLDRQVDWFVLREGRFESLSPADGVYRSAIFPGLWLDRVALLGGDLDRVLTVVREGLNSPEHAEFVARLEAAKARGDATGEPQ
ncbi:Uma2 family endonuclease [Aquisphaera insulae]|uniref:Uma2 family endonuclease n=1 Tax=Aquisphaera insulae TaxID=2712864 RepID=UPI0013EDB8E2|nr:Uma2 family endonuclease [Aquisphaera insulae]